MNHGSYSDSEFVSKVEEEAFNDASKDNSDEEEQISIQNQDEEIKQLDL